LDLCFFFFSTLFFFFFFFFYGIWSTSPSPFTFPCPQAQGGRSILEALPSYPVPFAPPFSLSGQGEDMRLSFFFFSPPRGSRFPRPPVLLGMDNRIEMHLFLQSLPPGARVKQPFFLSSSDPLFFFDRKYREIPSGFFLGHSTL